VVEIGILVKTGVTIPREEQAKGFPGSAPRWPQKGKKKKTTIQNVVTTLDHVAGQKRFRECNDKKKAVLSMGCMKSKKDKRTHKGRFGPGEILLNCGSRCDRSWQRGDRKKKKRSEGIKLLGRGKSLGVFG